MNRIPSSSRITLSKEKLAGILLGEGAKLPPMVPVRINASKLPHLLHQQHRLLGWSRSVHKTLAVQCHLEEVPHLHHHLPVGFDQKAKVLYHLIRKGRQIDLLRERHLLHAQQDTNSERLLHSQTPASLRIYRLRVSQKGIGQPRMSRILARLRRPGHRRHRWKTMIVRNPNLGSRPPSRASVKAQ